MLQDLEVQNNELVEANEKLQKELSMLRSLAKEAILEKKKSQAALEGLKHQVVQMLTERKILPKQEGPEQDAVPPASTGACSSSSKHDAWLPACSFACVARVSSSSVWLLFEPNLLPNQTGDNNDEAAHFAVNSPRAFLNWYRFTLCSVYNESQQILFPGAEADVCFAFI